MTSTETTRAVVTAYVQALQAGNQAALRAAFAPNATWTLPGDLPVSGTWTGPDGILDGFLAAMVARLDPATPVTQKLHRIIADGEYAVAEWTSSARSLAGREYRNDYAVAFRVADGLIVEVTEYTDTDYLRRVLFPEGG
jgi:ketosteroid isomerase-like protein